MDKDTRNAIERATQRARKLLEEDLTSQLEGTFDVLRAGTVAKNGGPHLSPRQGFQRLKMVAAIEHKQAAGMTAAEAVSDYIRDAAFTTLNRFVALKMLEARALVQECISRGDQSSGYREFCGLAPGVALLPDSAGYRIYLESLFDELSTEVKVLFDRHASASVLWPRRQTFEELLAVLNSEDVQTVWAEDETVGWVYQYFNSADERRAMREESQTPRTSRELAIRNQFFTPRYVVQFLTDNTLGRIWYEMRDGNTLLASTCTYLLRSSTGASEKRAKKDPRELRILDPACGSGHFLLYAFDLLLTIYEEAWADADAPTSHATGQSVSDDYPDIDAYRAAIPTLILRHNLYGIDIDPRCAQIAQLALWIRAQRAARDLKLSGRATITRTNIVVAEPMPGEPSFRREFIGSLDDQLGRLVDRVFDRMQLAGEAGSLLRIEHEIQAAIQEIYGGDGELFQAIDEGRWRGLEGELLAALHDYSARAQNQDSYQRQLFAEDAARGLSFIDVCRERYDVVLMNPPFGEFLDRLFGFLKTTYPLSKRDLAIVFVDRGIELLCPGGRVGALHSRKLFFIDTQSPWRKALVQQSQINPAADLGHRVLDGALVEVAASVFARGSGEYLFIDCLNAADKAAVIREVAASGGTHPAAYACRAEDFLALPGAQFAYRTPSELLQVFRRCEPLEPAIALCRDGLSTGDNPRFTRLFWECPVDWQSPGIWARLAKGGEYRPYFLDNELLLKWSDGRGEMAAFNLSLGNEARSRRGSKNYFRPALTYTGRTASALSMRILPKGTIFSDSGPAVLPEDEAYLPAVLGFMNSLTFSALHELCLGGGDSVSSGSAARDFTSGALGKMPAPPRDRLTALHWPVSSLVEIFIAEDQCRETSSVFCGLDSHEPDTTVVKLAELRLANWERRVVEAIRLSHEVEVAARSAYDLSEGANRAIAELAGPHPSQYPDDSTRIGADFEELFCATDDALVDRVAERLNFPRHITVKSFVVDRRYELLSHYYGVHPATLCARRAASGLLPAQRLTDMAVDVLSFAVGTVFGRWHRGTCYPPSYPDLITAGLPNQPPAFAGTQSSLFAVEDGGDPARDLACRVERALVEMFPRRADTAAELATILAGDSEALRLWLASEFFARHLQSHSMHRRRAPIYWQLTTSARRYGLWLYYPALKRDSLYQLLQDAVEPKLAFELRRYEEERLEAGASPSARSRSSLAAQEALLEDLRAFRAELARVAPLWNPDLNDGVVVNFAPLWRLVPQHRAWQKELKATWDGLCAGEYDWAHLAIHLWPERVVTKCASDRSLAIAHHLEDVFWIAGSDGKWKARTAPLRPLAELVGERSSPAVAAALKSVLEAPALGGAGRARGRSGATSPPAEDGSR